MARDYEVLDFKKGTFKDDYGNWYCNMALKGVGEPVTIAVKDPTQFETGMTLYGTIETKTSRAGKEYLKFKREQKEESVGTQGVAQKGSWQPESPERQDSINRSVAINNAAVVFQGTGVEAERVIAYADSFYTWLTAARATTAVDETFTGTEPVNLDDIPY